MKTIRPENKQKYRENPTNLEFWTESPAAGEADRKVIAMTEKGEGGRETEREAWAYRNLDCRISKSSSSTDRECECECDRECLYSIS